MVTQVAEKRVSKGQPRPHFNGAEPQHPPNFWDSYLRTHYAEFRTVTRGVGACFLGVGHVPIPKGRVPSFPLIFRTPRYLHGIVMSRHREQTGPDAKILASASTSWPRPRAFGLGRRPGLGLVNVIGLEKCAVQCKTILVVSISWLYHCKFVFAISLITYTNALASAALNNYYWLNFFVYIY